MSALPIHRIRGTELPRYTHPNGWRIVKAERSWCERVGAMRGASLAGPKRWYEVSSIYRRHDPNRSFNFGTLRDARAFCDETPNTLVRAQEDTP